MVAVVAREVDAYEVLESGAAGRQLREGRGLAAQLVADHRGDQVVLGLEVRIEGAVGQAGVGHQGRDPRAVDPVLLEATTSRLDDPPPGDVLVLLAVPGHHARSWLDVARPFIRAPPHCMPIDIRTTAEGRHAGEAPAPRGSGTVTGVEEKGPRQPE